MVMTPLLASFALKTSGGFSAGALREIGAELLLPFIAGHLLQPWIGRWGHTAAQAAGLGRSRLGVAGGLRRV
jgi:predicted Na+-dependent transporter